MNIELLEKEIAKTDYWDMRIWDIQTAYFGDEVYIYIENDEKKYWKISFLSCYKVSYETDANWRTIDHVKEMRGGQLGYDGQSISLKKYEKNEEFIDCTMDFSIMTMNIVCKEIQVEELEMTENQFFWQDN